MFGRSTADAWYCELLGDCLVRGYKLHTRNSECRRLIGVQKTFHCFPLISARRTAWKNCLREMEWFLSGSNFIDDLHPAVRSWWEPWAAENGEVHFNYSRQLRNYSGDCGSVDQIQYLIDTIREHPNSRRAVITTWNTADMVHSLCPITNCWGTVIQAFVEDGDLSLMTYQRSADVVCGLPHNLAQMWALLMWLARRGGKGVGKLIWVGGDVHLYECHAGLADRICDLHGDPKGYDYPPDLIYEPSSEEFLAEDFSLDGEYAPLIEERAEMVV